MLAVAEEDPAARFAASTETEVGRTAVLLLMRAVEAEVVAFVALVPV